MMLNNSKETVPIRTEIMDALLGYEDKLKNKCKKIKSKRILEARRAIERHQEKKQLSDNLDNYWLLD
ncbi:MAG: hypothetical protein V7784_21185, partial [Oceanospirillaceae bacterium]